ncbi:L,D-transpeptidase [Carbonactinospora thermoautotrophica]|nr:L,D-transpeptidase [Carbonactinospora thermoautotrophica]
MSSRPMLAVAGITGAALAVVGVLTLAAARSVPEPPGRTATTQGATVTASPTPTLSAAIVEVRPPARSGTGKRVVYSLSKQRVWLIDERNRVVRYYAVSGPRRSLPVGAYKVYERASTLADDPNGPPAQYVVRFAYGRDGKPLAFETVPGVDLLATGGQPSRDVRQRAADARALWDFAPVGTKIIVIR